MKYMSHAVVVVVVGVGEGVEVGFMCCEEYIGQW